MDSHDRPGLGTTGTRDTDTTLRPKVTGAPAAVTSPAVTPPLLSLPAVNVDDVGIHALTERQVTAHIAKQLGRGQGGLVVTPNLDHLKKLTQDEELARAYEAASLVLADGRPVLWAARASGSRLPERVPGSSLLWTLSAAVATSEARVLLLGGQAGAAREAAEKLSGRLPSLHVTGSDAPWVESPPTEAQVAGLSAIVAGAGAQVVFLAFGCPKQELIGAALGKRHPGTWFVGVGGAFEMAAGRVRRAPAVLQRTGMEWAYRLVQDPRRLARRYLVDDLAFLPGLLLRARRRARRGRVGPSELAPVRRTEDGGAEAA